MERGTPMTNQLSSGAKRPAVPPLHSPLVLGLQGIISYLYKRSQTKETCRCAASWAQSRPISESNEGISANHNPALQLNRFAIKYAWKQAQALICQTVREAAEH